MTETFSKSAHPAAASGAAQPGHAALILREQVGFLYGHLPVSQFITLLNALVLAAVLWLVVDPVTVIGWLACVCAVALVRVGHGVLFRRAMPDIADIPRWRGQFLIGVAAAGILWGSTPILLYVPHSVAHQAFVAFVLGGMVAGSVTTLTPVLGAFILFAVLALLPAIVLFPLTEGGTIHYAMGWMILLFLVAIIGIGRRVHRTIIESLDLRFRNSELIEYLTRNKERVDVLNRELLAAQAQLRKSNEELESRVATRTAELTKANAELEKFAFAASHDLQEPLRNVANFALLLEQRYKDRLDDDGREFIGYIVSGTVQMRQLVNDLLAFYRSDPESQTLGDVDCGAVLRKVLGSLRTAIEESGASVTSDPLPVIFANSGQLEQVLLNLLSNAIKFRGPDAPRIHVGMVQQGGWWVFSVRDNGIGIAPEYSDRIFGMFERLHGQDQYPGTGIGLALCRKIVEANDGRIWVESEKGRGATFYFRLPRYRSGPGAQGRAPRAGRDLAGRG